MSLLTLNFVLRSLGDVDVDTDAFGDPRSDTLDRLLFNRERRVKTELPGAERVHVADRAKEPEVLVDPLGASLGAVAIGQLVAEGTAEAEPIADLLLHQIERAGDGVRAGVVIDQRGHPATCRLHRPDEGARADRFGIERLVELPPQLLENLRERRWMEGRHGHASSQTAVQVRVGVDQAGDGQLPGSVDPLGPRVDVEGGRVLAGRNRGDSAISDQDCTAIDDLLSGPDCDRR